VNRAGWSRRAVLGAGLGSLGVGALAAAEPAFDRRFTSEHEGVFNGQRLIYEAVVEPTVLTDDAGRPTARLVTTSYLRSRVQDARRRPVIFGFAGGPSNASSAYHMHMLGPRRITRPEDGDSGDPRLTDNPHALLDVADVVLVDPVETGFSRVLPGGDRSRFYNITGDTRSIEQLIAAWLKAHGRDASPRYVMGGSYGSVRALRIGWDLRHTAPLDGVIMTANSTMIREMTGVIGQAASLPTQVMTALYHGRIDRAGRTDGEVADEAYAFAMGVYLPALARVQDLSLAERRRIAGELQARTSIGAEVYLANDLELSDDAFATLLLKDRGLVLDDPLDGRRTAPVGQPTAPQDGERRLFETYMREDLGVTYPMSAYRGAAPDTGGWTFEGPNGEARNDWGRLMREQMEANPKMRMLSANGYYDRTSLFAQARQVFSRTRLPRERIVVREYPGGHALYQTPETATRLAQDIRRMLTA